MEEVEEERQLREAFWEWRNGILHEHRVWNDRDMMSDVFGPTEDDPRGTLQCVSSSGYLDTDRWIMSGRREPDEGLPFQLNARRLEPRGHVVAGRAMSIGPELIMIRVEGIWVYGVVHEEGHRIYREPGMVRYRMAWIREEWRIMPALTMEEEDQAVARIRARASQPRRGTNEEWEQLRQDIRGLEDPRWQPTTAEGMRWMEEQRQDIGRRLQGYYNQDVQWQGADRGAGLGLARMMHFGGPVNWNGRMFGEGADGGQHLIMPQTPRSSMAEDFSINMEEDEYSPDESRNEIPGTRDHPEGGPLLGRPLRQRCTWSREDVASNQRGPWEKKDEQVWARYTEEAIAYSYTSATWMGPPLGRNRWEMSARRVEIMIQEE